MTRSLTHIIKGILWGMLIMSSIVAFAERNTNTKEAGLSLSQLEAYSDQEMYNWLLEEEYHQLLLLDPDTIPYDTTESKFRYWDKLGHWFEAYGYTQSGFMEEEMIDFKRAAFTNVYLEPLIDHKHWMFWVTNKITRAGNLQKTAPYVILQPEFVPADDEFSSYGLRITLKGSPEVQGQLAAIQTAVNANLQNASAVSPAAFESVLKTAASDALNRLASALGTSLAPPIVIGYEDGILLDGDVVQTYDGLDDNFRFQSLDNQLQPLDDSRVSWQNASKNGSYASTSMTGVNRKEVSVSYRGYTSIITIVKRGDLLDLRSIVKDQIIAVMRPRKEKYQDTLRVDQQNLATLDANLIEQLGLIEKGNLPLVADASIAPEPVFDEPVTLTDSSTFLNGEGSEVRREGFKMLRRKKGLEERVRKRINVIAFADLIVDNPDQLDDLADAVIRNSGRVLAQILFDNSTSGQDERVRNIIVDFLNANIEQLANSSSVAVTAVPVQLPVVEVTERPTFDLSVSRVYMNPLIPMTAQEKTDFITEMDTYLATLDEKVFVNVRYSQDVSTASYQSRASSGRPVGLPDDYKYINLDYVNIPGSVKFQVVGETPLPGGPGTPPTTGGAGNVLGALVYGYTGDESQPSTADLITERLRNLQEETGYEYLAILHCESCDNTPEDLSLPVQPDIRPLYDLGWDQELKITYQIPNTGGNQDIVGDKFEYVKKGSRACMLLYFRTMEQGYALETHLEATEPGTDHLIPQRPQLTVFDANNQFSQIDCDHKMGAWGRAICPTDQVEGVPFLPVLTDEYFDNLLTQVESCLNEREGGYANRISNFTSGRLALNDQQFIYDLYDGQKRIGERHNTKAHLIITDSYSSTGQMESAASYQAVEGEVVIWLHQNREGLWEYKSNIPEPAQEFFNIPDPEEPSKPWYSMDNLLGFLSERAADLDAVATAVYETMDWLGKGVRQAKIPAYVWNCNDPSYDSRYSEAYYYVTYPLNVVKNVLRDQMLASIDQSQMDPAWSKCIEDFRNGSVDFAFQAGLYNGLIEVVGSIFDLGKLVSGLASSKGREEFGKFFDQLERFQKEDGQGNIECSGSWCAIKTGFAEQFDPSKCCQFAELIGEIVGPIVISFINPEALAAVAETTAGRVLLQTIKLFNWIDKAGDPFQYLGRGLRYVGNGVSYIRSGTGKLLIRIENELIKAKILTESGIIEISRKFDEVTVLATENGTMQIRQGLDETLPAYRVVSGELEAIATTLTSKGARLAKIAKLSDVVDDLGALLNRVDKLGLRDADLNSLLDDLIANNTFRNDIARLNLTDGLIDKIGQSYKILKDGNRSTLRKSVETLESLAKVLDNTKAQSVFSDELNAIMTKFAKEAHTKSFFGKMSFKAHMDLLLDQINKYEGVAGFNKSIRDAMNNPNTNVQDGFWHSMADMKNRNLPKERIKKVDMEFDGEDLPCVNCKFDVELYSGSSGSLKYIEYKSYLDASKISKPQFLNYLSSIRSLDELKYVFNSKKLSIDQARAGVKTFVKENELTILENMPTGIRSQLNVAESAFELTESQIQAIANKITTVF